MTRVNDQEIKKATRLYKRGYAIKDIAKNIDRSCTTTTKILVGAGVHTLNFRLTQEERNKLIESLLAGTTLTEAAKLFNVDHDYVRKLVYRTSDTYYIKNDKLVIKATTSREQQVEVSTKHESTIKTAPLSDKEKEKDCIATILLDALIKSEEGSEILRRKGFKPVMEEVEAAVEAIIN